MDIFWVVFFLVFAIGLFIVWYIFYYKKSKLGSLCTNKITGKVIRYSAAEYNLT